MENGHPLPGRAAPELCQPHTSLSISAWGRLLLQAQAGARLPGLGGVVARAAPLLVGAKGSCGSEPAGHTRGAAGLRDPLSSRPRAGRSPSAVLGCAAGGLAL